jgi:hypothetical protein
VYVGTCEGNTENRQEEKRVKGLGDQRLDTEHHYVKEKEKDYPSNCWLKEKKKEKM